MKEEAQRRKEDAERERQRKKERAAREKEGQKIIAKTSPVVVSLRGALRHKKIESVPSWLVKGAQDTLKKLQLNASFLSTTHENEMNFCRKFPT